jgi:biopolymer transport protein TolR
MSMNVGPGNDGTMVEMNVTPLIDVLLVLIITFMVVTNLTPKGLNAMVPGLSTKTGNDQAIVVSIDASHQIQINRTLGSCRRARCATGRDL